jgi:peptide-methionine (R)-S-oxide reductase
MCALWRMANGCFTDVKREESPQMAKVSKTIEQWQAQLTSEQFEVTRNKATEKAFSGEYWDSKVPGVYACVCCASQVFDAADQYDAGTGWPSFSKPLKAGAVKTRKDPSLFMVRTEIICANCEAHFGHVFTDGPAAGGKRFSVNSAALRLNPLVDGE